MNSVFFTQRPVTHLLGVTVLLTLSLLKVNVVVAQSQNSTNPIPPKTIILLPEKPLSNTSKIVPSPAPITIQQYNRLMQAGYASAQLRHYPEARQRFQEALNLRPNDIYARQAIFNIDTYQAINKQKFPPLLFLLLGVLLMTFGSCGIFFFLLHQSQQQFLKTVLERRQHLDPLQQSLQNGIFPGLSTPSSSPVAEGVERGIPPSPSMPSGNWDIGGNAELTKTLVADLRTTEGRKRHKIIGELGQKGDSQAIKPLVDLMMTSDAQERKLILEALSQINGRSMTPMNQALALAHDGKEES